MSFREIRPLDPEIEELISSNQEPSASQRTALGQILPDRECCLCDIDAAIQELQIQRDRVHREVFGIRSALSPLRTMPNELLCRIWLFHLEGSEQNKYKRRGLPPQFIIAHVCLRWRAVIFNDGRFWTGVDSKHFDKYDKKLALDSLQFWLERSQPCSIELELPFWQPYLFQNDTSELSEILLPHTSRIKSLHLMYDKVNAEVLSSQNLKLQSLEKLRFVWMHDGTNVPCFDMPRLESLDLHLENLDGPSLNRAPASQFPYDQLTSLTIQYRFRTDPLPFLNIVLECKVLRSCTLSFPLYETDLNSPNAPQSAVLLPELESLSLQGFSATAGIPDFLSFILAPKLRSLLIKPGRHLMPRDLVWNHEGMQRWKKQCGFSLKSFLVQGLNFSLEDFLDFCSGMSTLEEIRVKIRSGGTEVLERLQAVGTDGSYLWPNLTSLSLRMGDPLWADYDEFGSLMIGLVESRCLPISEASESDRHSRLCAIRFGPVDVGGRANIYDLEAYLDPYRNEGLLLWLYHDR